MDHVHLVARLYVRTASPDPRDHHAAPGSAWRQVGPLWGAPLHVPEGDLLAVVDTGATPHSLSLEEHLPAGVRNLHLFGRAAPPRRWVEALPALGLRTLAIDTPGDLAPLAGCAETVEELVLGQIREFPAPPPLDPRRLEVLAGWAQLRRLTLGNVGAAGEPGWGQLPVERLTLWYARHQERAPKLGWLDSLPMLREIDLSLPDRDAGPALALARLRRLRSISLSLVSLTTALLRAWAALPELDTLDLFLSSVPSRVRDEIGGLGQIEHLAIRTSHESIELDAPLVGALAALPRLRSLIATQARISGPLRDLEPCGIERLTLTGCTIERSALRGLEALQTLRALHLSGSGDPDDELEDEDLAFLPRLRALESLILEDHALDFTALDAASFPRLVRLHLEPYCRPEALRLLVALPRLEDLCIGWETTEGLRFGPALRRLELRDMRIVPEAFADCTRLEMLSLGGSSPPLESLGGLRALRGLRTLAGPVQEEVPGWLVELPLLESLSIQCKGPPRLDTLAQLPRLTTLCLIDVRGALALPAGCSLQSLTLGSCQGIGGALFTSLAGQPIRDLNLFNVTLERRALGALNLPTLESLYLTCTKIPVEELLALSEMPLLHSLRGYPLPSPSEDLARLRRKFPACWDGAAPLDVGATGA